MTYRVKIHDIYEVFKRAHTQVLDEIYCDDRKAASPHALICSVWYEMYGVHVVYENSRAQWLDFDDERHFTIFCLKA